MTPLVMLPGMMCDTRLFLPQIETLEQERMVSVPSITGHATMEELARAVIADAPAHFSLAGLSMGGIVAMEMLRQAPDRIERIALLDTNPLAERPEVRERRGPQNSAARAGRLIEVMRDEMKPNYLVDNHRKPEILDLCMQMALDLGPDVFVRQSEALRDRRDQTDTLRQIHVPALVLCGRHDKLCPLERHEFMADLIPNAELVVIEDAGHLPTLEQPEATTDALVRWLNT